MEDYLKGLIKNNLKKFSLNPYIESIAANRIFSQLVLNPSFKSLCRFSGGIEPLHNDFMIEYPSGLAGGDPSQQQLSCKSENFITFLDKYICNYINPSLKNLHDPFIMKDMDKAVKRIIKALTDNETICVYGDYDVDGITSISFLVLFLREIQNCLLNYETEAGSLRFSYSKTKTDTMTDTTNPFCKTSTFKAGQGHERIIYKIPDRIKHGYGLGIEPINEIISLSNYNINENEPPKEAFTVLTAFRQVNLSSSTADRASANDIHPVSPDGLQSSHVSLIITVDLGITNFEEVKYAKSKNIDVIICDHHEVPEKIPEAVAILNPKQPDDIFPFKFLPGVGIAFNLAIALRKKMAEDGLINTYPNLKDYLDIVCLGIIADIVPICDENRTLVYYGLKKINNSPRHGLKELRKICNLNFDNVNEYDIAWKIAPRINSTGRIGSPEIAVELLMADTSENAKILSKKIEDLNKKRQALESECFVDALSQINYNTINAIKDMTEMRYASIETNYCKTCPIIILSSDLWHPGVIGIAASRLAEHFKKPVLLLSGFKKDILVGSARSYKNIDIYAFLKNFNEFYIKFGGHKMACGLTLKKSELNKFLDLVKNTDFKYMPQSSTEQLRSELQTTASGCSLPEDLSKGSVNHEPDKEPGAACDNASELKLNHINDNYDYDEELNIDKIKKGDMDNLMAGLKLMAPFGPLNEQPKFLMKSVILDNITEKEFKNTFSSNLNNHKGSGKTINTAVKSKHSYFTCNIKSKSNVNCKCGFTCEYWSPQRAKLLPSSCEQSQGYFNNKQDSNNFQKKAIIFKNTKLLKNKCQNNNHEVNDIIFEFFNNYIKILNIINKQAKA